MGGGGQQTSTTQTLQNPRVAYWGNQLLNRAGPYYLGNLNMPSSLNQGTAGFTPDQLYAMSQIGNTYGVGQGLAGAGTNYLENMLATSPTSTNVLSGLASGGGGLQSLLQPGGGLPSVSGLLSSMGLGGTTGMLANTIGGQYLDPATNPWLTSTYNEAAKGVTDAYNLGTAPSLMAEGQIAAGGGPGALAGSSAFNQQQWANQYGLGQNLNNLATDIYGGAYQQERQNQLAASQQAQGLAGLGANLAEAGTSNELSAEQLRANAAQTLQGGQLQAAGIIPSTQSSLYTPANQLLGVGSLQQQQQQTVLDTLFQNALRSANWPQAMFSGLASLFGPVAGNSGTQISTTPNTGGMK